jgi:hypothetical protein
MITTGKTFGVRFTYADGTIFVAGSWTVPHDSEYAEIEAMGSDLGWILIHEMAKQPNRTVAKAEILPWPISDDAP